MHDILSLPEGVGDLIARPLRPDDAAAVATLIAAQELHDIGEAVIEEADIISDWQRPTFDVGSNTVGLFDGDALIGYAEFSGHDRGDAAVHPNFRGRGIGTSLAYWMQNHARRAGSTLIGMPVPEGSPGDRLLVTLGYHIRWTSWVLALPEGRAIESQPLPSGFTLRTATEADRKPTWRVLEDAFLEWSDRDRQTFEDFAATVFLRPGFETWNLRVMADSAGEVVGAAYVFLADQTAFINKLAVRADQRGQGIARALLVDAFAQARAHGAVKSELSTDSRTGALGLYERVGMEVTSVWVNRAIRLDV